MAETDERTITIDGTEYRLADLSDAARNAAANINVTDAELRRLRVQTGIAQAARQRFAGQLQAELEGATAKEQEGDKA